jgi:hypothetical protein
MLVLECIFVGRQLMPLKSEQRWVEYKKTTVESQGKALDLFATNKVDSWLHFGMNQSEPLVDPDVENTTMGPLP